jgi:chemotaxis protein histidine kinase CheA
MCTERRYIAGAGACSHYLLESGAGAEICRRAEAVSMVVLQAEDRQFGLVVDGINDTQEIVVKPLGKQLKGLTLVRRRDDYG